MDRVFSVGEISDQFWSPPSAEPDSSKMNRSSSEWAFQQFLQEASVASHSSPQSSSAPSRAIGKTNVVEIKDNDSSFSSAINNDKVSVISSFTNRRSTSPFNVAAAAGAPPNIPVDSEEYQAFLKRKLNLACAAVAQSRVSFLKPQDAPGRADSGSHASNNSQLRSYPPKGAEHVLSIPQDMDANGAVEFPSLMKSRVPSSQTTSGSSREQSEDDENEGETEITENKDPTDAKRVRRMLSNRESARRSRRRKQAHLTDLETQVSQLRVKNSSLLKRLSDISQNYNEAAVDNRVLKADVETLKAKVKMAEETVKRITGLNTMFSIPDISTMSLSSFDGSLSDTSTDADLPVQNDTKHQFHQPQNNPIYSHDTTVNNGMAEISSLENVQPTSEAAGLAGIGRTVSLQRVASLEQLEKRIYGSVTSSRPQSNKEQ